MDGRFYCAMDGSYGFIRNNDGWVCVFVFMDGWNPLALVKKKTPGRISFGDSIPGVVAVTEW